jgi:hypothetical protein
MEDGKNRLLEQGLTGDSATSQRFQASLGVSQGEVCRRLLETLKSDACTHLDEPVGTLEGFSPSQLPAASFELELTGLIKQLPG